MTPEPPDHRAEARRGRLDVLPVAAAALPIGVLAGALAVSRGLSVVEAVLMSALVFAGGAQFAALGIWASPVPILGLAISTFLMNARHILMGASLRPKLKGFAPWQLFAGAYFLVDETWALAERRSMHRPVTPGYWFGMGLVIGSAWIGGSLLGAVLGSFVGDPGRIGADFVFTALFIGLIAGVWRGRTTAIVVAASAAAATAAYHLLGSPWHVVGGAAAGIVAAYATARPEEVKA
jgi:4-azaleucine resistance transporter AzlC